MKRMIGLLLLFALGCSHDSGSGMSTESSTPMNAREELQYHQALVRCAKTGGTRIVKIRSELRCY